MTNNLLEQAIDCNDGDRAAQIIQHALGIESDDVVNYVFPKTWPTDREQRARIIREWLQTEFGLVTSHARREWLSPHATSRRRGQ